VDHCPCKKHAAHSESAKRATAARVSSSGPGETNPTATRLATLAESRSVSEEVRELPSEAATSFALTASSFETLVQTLMR
jgi:hypothetical protein